MNQANTFFARPDSKCPPGRMAYALADGKKTTRDKVTVEIKIGRISATVFDDMGGLVCIHCLLDKMYLFDGVICHA